MKNKKWSKPKLLAALFVVALLVVILVLVVLNTGTKKESPEDNVPPTKTATIEDENVEVPSDVDPNKIVDYKLIAETEQYKIRQKDNEYKITLYAIINNPSQYEWYKEQLKEYKDAALNDLRQRGVNVDKATIEYEPKEAEQL